MSGRQPFASKSVGSALAVGLMLSGCSTAVLNPAGPIGGADRTILLDSMAIMLVIVIPTILCGWGFAWWFRASNTRAQRLPNFAYSGSVELVVWSIPLLTILLLGGVIWIGSHELDPADPIPSPNKAVEVQVVSLDWKWLFIYPDQGVAVGESPGHSSRNAGPLHADLGQRDEFLLHPAPGLDDLHHERHGRSVEPEGRHAGRSTPDCPAISAETAFPACTSPWTRCGRPTSRPGRRG